MNEGITVHPTYNEILQNVVDTYFKTKDFVYIAHRIHSYAVDPATYYDTAKIKNLKAFAVVSDDYVVLSNTQVEKLFFNKPFEIFEKLEDAVTWANSIMKQG